MTQVTREASEVAREMAKVEEAEPQRLYLAEMLLRGSDAQYHREEDAHADAQGTRVHNPVVGEMEQLYAPAARMLPSMCLVDKRNGQDAPQPAQSGLKGCPQIVIQGHQSPMKLAVVMRDNRHSDPGLCCQCGVRDPEGKVDEASRKLYCAACWELLEDMVALQAQADMLTVETSPGDDQGVVDQYATSTQT